jgi:hypothetical protein
MKHIIALFLISFLGSRILVFSLGSDPGRALEEAAIERYYTSIEIQQGDSLWSIADKYCNNSGMTVTEYVKELKNMNGLKEDIIHSGHYLTVMYSDLEQNP